MHDAPESVEPQAPPFALTSIPRVRSGPMTACTHSFPQFSSEATKLPSLLGSPSPLYFAYAG